MTRRQRILLSVIILFVAAAGWLTLGPPPVADNGWLSWALGWFRSDGDVNWPAFLRLEFLANIVLFVPVGMAFYVLTGRRNWWHALILAIALSVTIEIVQGSVGDRVPDLRDFAANALGAGIGIVVAVRVHRRKTSRAVTPRPPALD